MEFCFDFTLWNSGSAKTWPTGLFAMALALYLHILEAIYQATVKHKTLKDAW